MAEPLPPDDSLTLDLGVWEGPLDLLLALARAQKVDLREISILALVDQYLAVVGAGAPSLERAADWLVMAAWLALLKSALLLPADPEAEPDPEELAALLTRRLRRLDAMREAGAALMARDRLGRDVFARGAPEGLALVRLPRWRASLHDLLAARGAVAERNRPVLHLVARRPVVTLEEALARVEAMLGAAAGWSALDRFVARTDDRRRARSGLASGFLAMLELARQGRVELRQGDPFATLWVRAA